MMKPANRTTLSVHELAAEMGISLSLAYDLVKQPGFPSIRISERRIIIPRAELDEWLREQARTGSVG